MSDLIGKYIQSAKDVGCPREQIENFIRYGIVLQPKQLVASANARLCDTPGGPTELGYGGARAGGKSFWGLAQVGADDCQRFPGLKCLILRQVGKAAKESVDDLRRHVLHSVPHQWKPTQASIFFPNGSRIIVGHFKNESDVDAYLGLEYDLILVEEATTLTSSKYKDIWTCCRTSKMGWRPRMYSTTNPGGVGHAYYKSRFVDPFFRHTEKDTRFIPSTVYDNAFVNPEYKRSLEGQVGWKRKAWLLGEWDIAAGQFFTNFNRDLHIIPSIHTLPDDWMIWGALDYGFTHYTVFYLMAKDGDGNVIAIDEHAERRWLPQQHVGAIYAMLGRHKLQIGHLRRVVAGPDVFSKDRRGRTTAMEYKDLGITLKPAHTDRINGASEILRRLGDAEHGIPPSTYITESCVKLQECLPLMEHDPHRPEDVLKVDVDEEGIGGDDPYDCYRYGIMEAYAPPKNIVKMGSSKNRSKSRYSYA